MTDKNFWNLYPLYMEHPPLIEDPADLVIKRHKGGSSRCAFWAGYDGITKGPRKGAPGSVDRSAFRAGVDYRKLVKKGERDPLPHSDGSIPGRNK